MPETFAIQKPNGRTYHIIYFPFSLLSYFMLIFYQVLRFIKVVWVQFKLLRKRPYIKIEWCEKALKEFVRKEIQPDGRIRYWIFVKEIDRYLE